MTSARGLIGTQARLGILPAGTYNNVARSLGISRVQLYRKVKAILGTGVTDFIQGIRLTKARQLLLNEDQTIAEVAYQLGFSSPSTTSSGSSRMAVGSWTSIDRNRV